MYFPQRIVYNQYIFAFLNRLSLIEPGPVVTEFERKVFEDGMKMDLSAADEETAEMFTNIYLKNYKQIFQSLGQSAEDVAEVTHQQFSIFFLGKKFFFFNL